MMTQEQIDAEQALLAKQRLDEANNFERVAETAEPITAEAADAVTPMDLLVAENYTTKGIRDERFATCKDCDRLFKTTRTCKECGCFMALKTWLIEASCPIGKWGQA